MSELKQQLLDNGWEEVDIAFFVHPRMKPGFFVDMNGCTDAYVIEKEGCSEPWSVCFSYEDLESRYLE